MAKSVKNVEETALPTGLKDLIAMAKDLGIKYSFQKKDELIKLITEAKAGKGSTKSDTKLVEDHEVVSEKKTKGKAKTKDAEEIVLPDPEDDGNEEEHEEESSETEEAAEIVDEKPKKDKKKRALSVDSSESKKKTSSTAEDIEALRERKDVKEIMEKPEYTKSDKVRKLYQRAKLSIGEISKLVDIHYSFAYCVVDKFRKELLETGKGK